MKKLTTAIVLCAASLAQAGPTEVAQATDARCRKDVKDYVETLKFVRQAAGDQIGDKVAKGYVSEEELGKAVAAKGHCGAAQLLRERGVSR